MRTTAVAAASLCLFSMSLSAAPTRSQCNEQLDEKEPCIRLSDDGKTKWIDGSLLPLEGRPYADAEKPYQRIPDRLKSVTNVNIGVWKQGVNSAGMLFRFHVEKSSQLKVRWSVLYEQLYSRNSSPRGRSGVDFYSWDAHDGEWRFGMSAYPARRENNECEFWVPQSGDAMIYLPCYNGTTKFELGVSPEAVVSPVLHRKYGIEKPIVFYGTSITQGGCTSRPALAYPAVVSRRLDAPHVNLGFAGNGRMEIEMADMLLEIDASAYVLDCLWNMNDDLVKKNFEPFLRRLKAAKRDVPILTVEMCVVENVPNKKSLFVREVVERLKRENPGMWANLHHLPAEVLLPPDYDGTVDRCHPNDWGMMKIADEMHRVLKPVLASGVKTIGAIDEINEAVVPSERGAKTVAADDRWDWIDGRDIPMEGRAFDDGLTHYCRLPASAKDKVVNGIWQMCQCPAGMQYRFTTDSRKLKFVWSLTSPRLSSRNVPLCARSGIDVYAWRTERPDGTVTDGEWRFRCAPTPTGQYTNEYEISWGGEKVPCLINLPLYNGISEFRLGVEKGAKIKPLATPHRSGVAKPVVFYGGSIVQGASASRPGTCWPNLVGRMLDVPIVNMGFNGQGKMEDVFVDYLAAADASCYVFMNFGNMGINLAEERYEKFLRALHAKRPDAPLVIGQHCYYLDARGPLHAFAPKMIERLRKEDPEFAKCLHLVRLEDMFAPDSDGTIDGGHPNDWGSMHMAKAFSAVIAKALGINGEGR